MEDPFEMVHLEDTKLYKLITKGSAKSLREAWHLIGSLPEDEITLRSQHDNSTYLHHIVLVATDVYKRRETLTPLIPLIYRLALRGIQVNAQNFHGNTCLHLACLRPNADGLCQHLIRIGADPCIQNTKQGRIIHTYHNHKCVMVKGQSSAHSGLWNAVEMENLQLVEGLMKTWCRVLINKNKRLKQVADETSNVLIIKTLQKYEKTNELVCAALACDVQRVRELLKTGGVDLNQRDESCAVPKPLLVAVEELGDIATGMVSLLKDSGANGTILTDYIERIQDWENGFENSELFTEVEKETEESFLKALDIISSKNFNITLVSNREKTKGWSYLHYIVDKYIKVKEENEERSRLLFRAIYRLALAGIDVNARDAQGNTAIVKATRNLDQNLITHLIRLGCDASMSDSNGRSVNEEVYKFRGLLVFDNKYKTADLPGLWVAIETNNVKKVERWLKSWARVNVKRGDRRLIDIARAKKQNEIVQLLEEYEHVNEFVCATFACDLKRMMEILALGKGKNKVNTIDNCFHVGFTWDHHAEFMSRPIIITAMEICSPEVVDFLLRFGADLSKDYEESAPCGPAAFWAFRDHVDNRNALVVAKHADVKLRDELGASMLHKILQKDRVDGKQEVVQALLDRGADVAARDFEGSTPRDYVTIYNLTDGDILRQVIDNYVLNLVNNEQCYKIEDLLLDDYDHLVDVTGTKKNKTAKELAELKGYNDILELIKDWQGYRGQCNILHESAQTGDLRTISKMSGEKRCAWSKDKAGRSLLHNAVLYEHPEICKFLTEQFPHLINSRDSRNRTPLHICVCLKERQQIWKILQEGGADTKLKDVNNLSVSDYIRQQEKPTPTKSRPRGRRWQDYRPSNIIEYERNMQYGAKAERYEMQRALLNALKDASLSDIKKLTQNFTGDLSKDDLDKSLLTRCVELKRQEVAKHLISSCRARAHLSVEVVDSTKEIKIMTLNDYAKKKGLTDLVELIKTIPNPEDSKPLEDNVESTPDTPSGS